MAKTKGLSLNSTMYLNQWNDVNALNADPRSAAAVALRPVYATRAAAFTTDLGLTAPVVARANFDTTGITDVKDEAKLAAATAYGIITDNCFSFASQFNKTDLKALMLNATTSKINKAKDIDFVGVCTNLNTLLTAVIATNPVTAIEYFTAAQLATAAALVVTYTTKFGAFQVAEEDIRAAKKEFRLTWMPKMKAHIKYMTKMLSGAITTAFPTYAKSFLGLIKLVVVGKRDQGFLPTVVDINTGLPFANIATIVPTNYPVTKVSKLGKSDGSGNFKTLKLKIGLWRIQVLVPGYADQFIMVKVTSKEVVKLTVKMKPI